MNQNTKAPDNPTTELYIHTIINRQMCDAHKAPIGIPCWHIQRSNFGYLPAICNKRATRAGFNHPISHKALRLHPKK